MSDDEIKALRVRNFIETLKTLPGMILGGEDHLFARFSAFYRGLRFCKQLEEENMEDFASILGRIYVTLSNRLGVEAYLLNESNMNEKQEFQMNEKKEFEKFIRLLEESSREAGLI